MGPCARVSHLRFRCAPTRDGRFGGHGFVGVGGLQRRPGLASGAALPFGYSAARLSKEQGVVTVDLLFMPEQAVRGVMVRMTGLLEGERLNLDLAATVVALIEREGDLFTVTTTGGTYRVAADGPTECFLYTAGWLLVFGACVVATFGTPAALICVAEGTAGAIGGQEICASLNEADLEPEAQVVNGDPSDPGVSEAFFTLKGNDTVAAVRRLTVPFTTCSACRRNTYANQSGMSFHYFTPLGCSQTKDVYGTIEYPTGWKTDGVKVTVQNTSCGPVALPL